MVRDPHLAQDVTQAVFLALARHAAELLDRPVLSGWLHRAAQNLAANTVRSDVRRRARELEAATVNELLSTDPDAPWDQIAPDLDAVLGGLSEPDREVVLLRYFEGKSASQMARILGTSDEAAQKRLNRAVERLRERFAARGLGASARALALVISANAVQAPPADLASTIVAAATSATGAATGMSAAACAMKTHAAAGMLARFTRPKMAIGAATTAIILVGTVLGLMLRPQRPGSAPMATTTPDAPSGPVAATAGGAPPLPIVNPDDTQPPPDPLRLLQAVAQARQNVGSGSFEFQVVSDQTWAGRRSTNELRLEVVFDGSKLRAEQFGSEFSYTYAPDAAEQEQIRQRADGMDRAAAVQAGLLKPFESHHTRIYDGAALMDYWENDGKPHGTTISDPNRGDAPSRFFDPRCLGLNAFPAVGHTVELCLGYPEAKSIRLVGPEAVDGVPAWHVQVRSKRDALLEFWIDIARPTRVLKHAVDGQIARSTYDPARPRDPIPAEVVTSSPRAGSEPIRERWVRSSAALNVPVDPASFTLACLNMQTGTSVIDARIQRSIGYWTGSGLSEQPPRPSGPDTAAAPTRDEQLMLVENHPGSPEGLAAATWVLLNTPDGPEVEKAAEAILRYHTRNPSLAGLCQELERLRHRCSQPLLEAILNVNPSIDARGLACFALATMFKDHASCGQNAKAMDAAIRHFERARTEFGQVPLRGFPLADLTGPELHELRDLCIGKPAPEIAGQDLDGRPLKLSDYRGKIVVLVFWWPGYTEGSEHRQLIEAMAGKPVAILGVYGDDNLAKARAYIAQHRITWPSFWDKRGGPIASNYNVRSWPDRWVIDAQGVIRHRDLRGRDLHDAVHRLVGE
jgi:RNA polymerase sigma factor (sigma-70 family)